MTRILLFIDQPEPGCAWYEDPRSSRELMYLVNTGQLCIGGELPELDARERPQNAFSMPDQDMVSVAFSPHYVDLTAEMYQLLFRLLDGQTAAQAAAQMGHDDAWVAHLLAVMYQRFGVHSTPDMLIAAETVGMI